MAIYLKNSVFLHIPKTGGTWVRLRLQEAGLIKRISHGNDFEPGFGVNSIHNIPIYDKEFQNKKTRFCFVRNPYTWYKSYYGYRKRFPWDEKSCIDIQCKAESFNEFVESVKERPGKDLAYMLDSSKAAAMLDWEETVSLEEGIKQVIEWVDIHLKTIKNQPWDYIHKA